MATVKGVIQEIQTKSVAGGRTAYGVVVGGQAYGAGLYAPKAKVGDYVEFGVDESRGYKNIERNTLKVLPYKPSPEEKAAAAAPVSKPAASSYDARQDAISRQAASNTALAYLQLQQAVGALPLPSKKADVAQALDALLYETTVMFYEQNTGVKWKDIGPKKAADSDEGGEEEEASDPEDQPWE